MRMPRLPSLCLFVAVSVFSPGLYGYDRAAFERHETVELPALSFSGAAADDALDTYIQGVMATKHIPGVSAAIVKRNQILWKKAYGIKAISPQEPAGESTLFMLASVTKTLTGTALMTLYDQGLFDLQDPVNDHLPFEVINPHQNSTTITVEMLLTHMSSIKDNWTYMPYYPGDSPIPLGDYLYEYFTPGGAYYDPNKNFHTYEPGNVYSYSNIGLALAGYLVECISGAPLEEYAQDHLFGPVGMNETSYFLANLDVDHIAMPMYWNGSQYVAYGHFGYSDYPSGQVRTSAPQLARFLYTFMHNRKPSKVVVFPRRQFNGAGQSSGDLAHAPQGGASFIPSAGDALPLVRILDDRTARLMTTPIHPQIDPYQGLVFYRWNLSGRILWGHNGGDQGVTTEMWYSLDEETGVVCLTNGESYLNEIVNALFEYAETR